MQHHELTARAQPWIAPSSAALRLWHGSTPTPPLKMQVSNGYLLFFAALFLAFIIFY
jgi:hypothetical protein